MENGKKKGVLISLIFGALFASGIVTLWVFFIRDINRYGGISFQNFNEIEFDQIKLLALFIIITAGSLAGLVLNIMAWLKQNEKFVLASGIAYIFGANPISAIICFVEYFDIKTSIKNKTLVYTALFSCLLAVLWTILWIFFGRDDSGIMSFWLFTSIAMGIGVVFNFLTWKFDEGEQKGIMGAIAGIFYILGIITVVSAIICFIRTNSYIKNKLLFYTSLSSCLFIAFWMVLYAATPEFRYPYVVFMGVAMIIGTVFNFLTWKKYDDEKFRAITGVIAGAFYILGSITIIQAIICFIRTSSYIKNKLLFYTALFSCLLAVFWSIFEIFIGRDVSEMMPFVLFTTIAIGAGVVFNFLAWKTGVKKMKIIAGILYLLGIFTVISAIICFICSRNNRKLAAS